MIFTTNYDPSIEIWCQKRNILIYDGTHPTQNPEIRGMRPINESQVNVGNTSLQETQLALKIVRLHGSVWIYETKSKTRIKMTRPRDKLLFTDWYPHLNEKPLMIFPGQESILASGEWDVQYQYFKEMLKGVCLVIGYSFQDPLINGAFLDNLDKRILRTIGILSPNPDEAVKNLFWDRDIPQKRIVCIPAEFGTSEALQGIDKSWLFDLLGTQTSGLEQYISKRNEETKSYLN